MARPSEPKAQAQQILALLPVLRQWVTTRVQQVGESHNLSLRQYAALDAIRRGASSPGELARLWQVTPGALTGVIDRLERRGLVQREPDPHDRRRLRLVLTDQGMTLSIEAENALTSDLAGSLSHASPEDVAGLGRALVLLHDALVALQAQYPGDFQSTVIDESGWDTGDERPDTLSARNSDAVSD